MKTKFNYFNQLVNVDDGNALQVSGCTFDGRCEMEPWARVVVRRGEFEMGNVEIRSCSPMALRKIASRLFHEAAKLEAMQVADGSAEEAAS